MAYTTIKKPSEYFNTNLYTGNGGTQSFTEIGFQPDWVWIKNRSGTEDHMLYDAVRGVTKDIRANQTNAESTNANSLTAFETDGYSIGSSGNINNNGSNFVGWNWKANGAGSSNTDGSITSTVSANTTSGFSIVSYTGTGANATVGHGLGVAPKMIIFKNRTVARNWISYHDSIGATKFMYFNLTNAETTDSTAFNNTAPTSSVFSLGSNVGGNESGSSMIAYCFAEVKGFSKFGSYTGNGSTDGAFIYTGFKPAWLMVKRTDIGDGWTIVDNKRNTYNLVTQRLQAQVSDAESALDLIDFTSNGFKNRNNFVSWNSSGGTYIYMAFAEEPLVGDNPATAR